MRGHILTGRVDHVSEVAERQLVQPVAGVVDIEGAPAPVRRLHPDEPIEAALNGLRPDSELAQPETDHRGIVDVRVEVVFELEGPPSRLQVGAANRPVALDADLLPEEPRAGPPQLLILRRDPRLEQRKHGQPGVPGWRLTCLRAEAVAVFNHEYAPAVHGAPERVVLEP